MSVISRFLTGVLTELRQKRLWPIAAVLLVALVAVPVLLAKSSHPVRSALVPVATPPPSPATSLPALNVQSTPPHSRLSGHAHNPFGNPSSSSTTSPSAPTVSSAPTTAASPTTGTSSPVTGGAGTSSTGTPLASSAPVTSGTPGNPPSITPNAHPKPAPSGLTPTQSYDVAMAITAPAGGINTVDPLTRLSLIPSDHQPLLVELGVLGGGGKVVFAVQPNAVVNGPGTCTPGPLDCEILTLGQDQTEQLSTRTGSVGVSQVALFAITGITATNHPSVSAADRARRAQSAAGRAVLNQSSLPSISLFQYDPSLGFVIDKRNLTVGVANAS